MKKQILIYFIFLSIIISAQNSRWKDYFSYSNVKQIIQVENKIFASTEGGLFSLDLSSSEIKKISKVNGLNGVNISSFDYNKENQVFLIGYSDGKLDIFNPNGTKLNIDIPIDQDFQGSKEIKHIYSKGNFAVFSMDFGVLYFDINRKEFKETIYFRENQGFIKVNKSIIYDNKIFSATEKGLYNKVIDVSLPNFLTWEKSFDNQNVTNLESISGNILFSNNNTVWNLNLSNNNINIFYSGSLINNIYNNKNFISITDNNKANIYNQDLNLVNQLDFNQKLNSSILVENNIFGATSNQGIIDESFQSFFPDGPATNKSNKLSLLEDKIWIVPSSLSNFFIPEDIPYGFYYFNENNWIHQTSETLNNSKNIIDVIPNPFKENEVFAIAYDFGNQGIMQINDGKLTQVFNQRNSVISEPNHLVGGVYEPKTGDLFVTERTSIFGPSSGHSVLVKNQKNDISRTSLIPVNISQATAVGFPKIDSQNSMLYIPGPRGDGLEVLDYNKTPTNFSDDNLYVISSLENQGNLPNNNVICSNIDSDGTLWIGTTTGIRYLKNPKKEISSGNFKTEKVVISENGIGEEFLRDIQINDIEIDRANRKWIATENAGVFYVSADAKNLINIFDVNNSPLPSNSVKDIEINHSKGIVYFATPLGTVSYSSDIADVNYDFKQAFIYPNPVRPNYSGFVTIRNLPNNSIIKIMDLNSNLLFEQRSQGGIVQWNQKNLKGNLVASGIYIVYMTLADGSETGSSKIAIIR